MEASPAAVTTDELRFLSSTFCIPGPVPSRSQVFTCFHHMSFTARYEGDKFMTLTAG